ncbi:hypothetical protein CHUAL_005461 [Chamberlinius hualienensis]
MDLRLSDVYQTILVSPSSRVTTLLDENPEVVNFRVWHGLTLLHHICMRGTDEHVISIFVSRGADANSRSDSGETPLHYACRKGNLPVVSEMVNHGGDPNAVDNAGHSCMHFASQGNAVSVMVYLRDICGLPYDGISSARQTALHVAALHGHWQVSAFLLRKKRCDAYSQDIMGNTALHLAAMKGEAVICYQIISNAGYDILPLTNSQGETAVQIAHSGTAVSHRETEMLLSHRLSNPMLLWISKLISPILLGGFVPLTINIWKPSMQIIYWVILMFGFGFWVHVQHHRLTHPSRWSNPARAGIFIWGIFSNLILYFGYLSPVTTNYWPVTLLSWTAIFLSAFSTLSFYTSSPGVYNDHTGDWEPLLKGLRGAGFCDECEIVQKPGVRHCRMCGKCYWHLQHHCLFLLRCVTAANAKYFLLILIAIVTSCIAYICNFVMFIQYKLHNNETSQGSNVEMNLVDHFWLLIILVADLVCACSCLFLIKLQVTNPYGWNLKREQPKTTYQA